MTFAKNLMDRVESLEEDVKDLRKDLNIVSRNFSTAINFIERMVFWAKGGSKPPIPGMSRSSKITSNGPCSAILVSARSSVSARCGAKPPSARRNSSSDSASKT